MNVMDFLRGLGSSVASNNPVTMAVDTGANIADLGIAAAGYLGHKAGMLKADQLPEPLDKSRIPGSSAWLDKSMGVNGSTEATVGSLAGMFVNPGRAARKVIIETSKLPGGAAAEEQMRKLKQMIDSPNVLPQQRAKAEKMLDLAERSQRSKYIPEVDKYFTHIPDDLRLLNKEKFEELRSGKVASLKLSDLYDHRVLKKIVPKEFWDMEVKRSDKHAPGGGYFQAGRSQWAIRKDPSGLGFNVVTPTGYALDPTGATKKYLSKEDAQADAEKMVRIYGIPDQGRLVFHQGGSLNDDLTTFFHELQHAAATWTKGYQGGNYESIVGDTTTLIQAVDNLNKSKASVSLIKELRDMHKNGLGLEDYMELKGYTHGNIPGKVLSAWEYVNDSIDPLAKGAAKYKALSDKVLDEIPTRSAERLESVRARVGAADVDIKRVNDMLAEQKYQIGGKMSKAEMDLGFDLYERRLDEQFARSNANYVHKPWEGGFGSFNSSGPSIPFRNLSGPLDVSEPLLKGDPSLFFDPRQFRL